MNTNKIKYTAAACLLALSSQFASAQTAIRTGYFAENYMYKHELNPALAPNRSYFALPVLGGLNITTNSNIGINNFLFPSNGKLLTGLHPDITSKQFLGGLKSSNRLGVDFSMPILSVGFRGIGGYNTIGVSVRENTSANIPKGLFKFLKEGRNGGDVFDLGNLGLKSDTYVEIALGHQHKINDEISVGGKMKILLGAAHADAFINNMTVEMADDHWKIDADGSMNLAGAGLVIPTKADSNDPSKQVFDFDNIGDPKGKIGGAGVAFDLGVNYKIKAVEGLEVSAAVLDLGFINWKTVNNGKMNSSWQFDGFDLSDDDKSLNDQLDEIGDQLKDFASFEPGKTTSKTRALGATLNIGASYALPMYDRLKFGFLSSTRINGVNSWSEGRFSANINPIGGFDFSINYAISTFGSSLGMLLNYSTKGFSIFAGTDHMIGKLTPQYIPMSGRTSATFGIVFPLDSKKKM